jgi:hypothetical protein
VMRISSPPCSTVEFCLAYPMTRHDLRVAETALTADFFRERAELCSLLAATGQAAKPIFSRLSLLAEEYKAKAKSIEARAVVDSGGVAADPVNLLELATVDGPGLAALGVKTAASFTSVADDEIRR